MFVVNTNKATSWAALCLALLAACSLGAPAPLPAREVALGSQALVQDPPGLIAPPGPPEPDADGIVTAEVINVQKQVVILVQSTNTVEGGLRRQAIRDTWLQVLNRTSTLALPMEQRRSVVVWFVVPRGGALADDVVEAEGKKHGDIIFTRQSVVGADDTDLFVSVCRWLRVAYFERYNFAAFLRDDSFVNIANLLSYLSSSVQPGTLFYGGHVSSFTKDPSGDGYYAPYVSKGTVVISSGFVDIVARDAAFMKHITSDYDVGVGAFLQPFKTGAPTSIPGCVANLKTVYEPVLNPVVVNGASPELMLALANPPGELPAQVEHVDTYSFHINPHPSTDNEPLCTGLDDTGACKIAAKMLSDPDFDKSPMHEKPEPNEFLRGYPKPYGPGGEYPDAPGPSAASA